MSWLAIRVAVALGILSGIAMPFHAVAVPLEQIDAVNIIPDQTCYNTSDPQKIFVEFLDSSRSRVDPDKLDWPDIVLEWRITNGPVIQPNALSEFEHLETGRFRFDDKTSSQEGTRSLTIQFPDPDNRTFGPVTFEVPCAGFPGLNVQYQGKVSSLTGGTKPTFDLLVKRSFWGPIQENETAHVTYSGKVATCPSGKAPMDSIKNDDMVEVIGETQDIADQVEASCIPHKIILLEAPKPDLIISDISPSPLNPTAGQTVKFTVTVKNQGGASAGPSHAGLSVGGTPLANQPVKSLDPGETDSVIFTWDASCGGSGEVIATADVSSEVDEGTDGEGNNQFKDTLTCALPDLVITGVSPSPQNATVGQDLTVTVIVMNKGSVDAGPFTVSLIESDSQYSREQSVDGLKAGETKKVPMPSIPVVTICNASPSMYFGVDSKQQVTESNEHNNEFQKIIDVICVDLIVTGISWIPQKPNGNQGVQFTVTVQARREGDAGPFKVGLIVGGTPLASQPVNGLAGQTSKDVKFPLWPAACGPSTQSSFTVVATVDVENNVIESVEINNTLSKTITVNCPQLPDLEIVSLDLTPSTPTPGQSVTIKAMVKNSWRKNAGPFKVGLFAGETTLPDQPVTGLDVGKTKPVSFQWTAICGPSDIDATADTENKIKEIDENNNVLHNNLRIDCPTKFQGKVIFSIDNPQPSGEMVALIIPDYRVVVDKVLSGNAKVGVTMDIWAFPCEKGKQAQVAKLKVGDWAEVFGGLSGEGSIFPDCLPYYVRKLRGNQAPKADFTFTPASPMQGETITFDPKKSTDKDGSIVSYEWDFDGDGTYEVKTNENATQQKSFGISKPAKVCLRVTDDVGAAGSVCKSLPLQAIRQITGKIEIEDLGFSYGQVKLSIRRSNGSDDLCKVDIDCVYADESGLFSFSLKKPPDLSNATGIEVTVYSESRIVRIEKPDSGGLYSASESIPLSLVTIDKNG
ncbi:MAG: hypothetical protein HY258_02540, partial [Chloroflexi bacterium]|nr:hypothetical protein [Chloroflexota bacterium]